MQVSARRGKVENFVKFRFAKAKFRYGKIRA